MSAARIGAIAALILALAVVMGAFGAHALRDRLDAYALDVYQKAAFYHFVRGLAILSVALMSATALLDLRAAGWAAALFGAGTLVFSGSLYVLAITGLRWLGAITPIGGTLFIVGWLYLALQLWRHGRPGS